MNFAGQFIYLGWWWFRAFFFGRRKPLQSVIFISNRCNLSCRHCSVYDHEAPIDKSYLQVCKDLEYCYSLGARFVDFEGGEPFIWKDGDKTVNDLCRYARSIGFYTCTITTNAQKPFDGSVADSIWVSMDGVGEYHDKVRGEGTFARLEQNIATCGCRHLSVNMAINTLNCDSVAAAIEYASKSRYLESISLNFHTPFPGTEALEVPHEKRVEIINMILDYKKRGYPIMNSTAGLRKMKDNDFVMRCWISNFVFVDGTRSPQCIGAEMGICPKCGFCMAGEESAVFELRPGTILAALKLRK
jgi:MoaA/NifB/PqqE/SkfB family radical SAM enzyme